MELVGLLVDGNNCAHSISHRLLVLLEEPKFFQWEVRAKIGVSLSKAFQQTHHTGQTHAMVCDEQHFASAEV